MTDETLDDGRYQPQGAIGIGAMARVFRAFDVRLERTVAIKMLHEPLAAEQQVVERFKLEGRIAAGLAHPNIVSVYDFGEEQGRPFMVMEYVPGKNLRQVVAREAPMPVNRATAIMRQLAAALDFAHANGVIHRDIKPENILLTDRGEVKVGDFGIARALAGTSLTTAGTVLGTAAYASPEQVSGQVVTAESDIYSAGIVLYEMLTGRVPFAGENSVAVAMAQVNEIPEPPSVHVPGLPRGVEAVVLMALAKQPAERFHSGYEMVMALNSAGKVAWAPPVEASPERAGGRRGARRAGGEPVTAKTLIAPQVPVPAPSRPSRGRAKQIPGLLLVCVVLAVLAAMFYRGQISGGGSPSVSGPAVTPSSSTAGAAVDTRQVQPAASGVVGSSHGATIALVTAAGVSQNYLPVGVSTRFHMSGGDVFAVATVRNKAQGDAVKFTWLYPDGSTFVYNNGVIASYVGTVVAYGQLTPRMPGAYTVSTAINGRTLATASFTVISG